MSSPRSRADRRPAPGAGQYGLIVGLSAALAIVILVVFGDQVADVVHWIAQLVEGEG
jgi:hypothetical protein